MKSITRFIKAQRDYFDIALNEIESGCKKTHWMWFIFPQIKGLGYSSISQYYAIENREEAEEYLGTYPLGNRLLRMCNALLDQDTNDAEKIFGPVDSVKLKSSMTLFYEVSRFHVFKDVLDKFFDGKLCNRTIDILEKEAQTCSH